MVHWVMRQDASNSTFMVFQCCCDGGLLNSSNNKNETPPNEKRNETEMKKKCFFQERCKDKTYKVISRESCPDQISGGVFGFQWINLDIYSTGF